MVVYAPLGEGISAALRKSSYACAFAVVASLRRSHRRSNHRKGFRRGRGAITAIVLRGYNVVEGDVETLMDRASIVMRTRAYIGHAQ